MFESCKFFNERFTRLEYETILIKLIQDFEVCNLKIYIKTKKIKIPLRKKNTITENLYYIFTFVFNYLS
jgi:hypothetical protein